MIADPILASMASNLTTFVTNLVLAEISKQQAVKDDVIRLKKNYERVVLMIKSAERKVMLDDEVARFWMKRVKDHVYEVEIIIDHWIVRNEKRRQRDAQRELGYHKWSLKCCDCLSLKTFADAIKVLNEDFEDILKIPAETKADEQIVVRSYGKTAPNYNADITGAYVTKDANNIIKLLEDPATKCRLIAIVGMAGIGKTSLAREVYHNVKVATGNNQDFDTKLWIRFSKDLRSLIIWSDCRKEGPTKTQLLQLGTEITNKKFLLVVDDVWTENVWETLLEGPLQQRNPKSSKVIVTTRNKNVAKRIGAGHIHNVKRMNNIDAWRLLCQRASLSQNDEKDLKDIGQQIVDKCDGLPLAIRSIGRTLRGQEPTRHDWENAYRTAFQDLSPEEQYMINLSFQDLSSHMRQCFLYCSVFPEGFFIEKQYIIQQWISEGFIVKKRQSTLEEIAECCFYELVGRGLLHLEFGNDGVIGAKMPIIIRSFAKDVSDYENFCNESMSTDLPEARRLSIVANNNEENIHNIDDNKNRGTNSENATVKDILDSNMASNYWDNELRNNTNSGGSETIGVVVENNDAIHRNESRNNAKNGESARLHELKSTKYLRTLILRKSIVQDGIQTDTLKQLKLLRVLDLREAKGIKTLPLTIGNLEHLRYLNISETNIRKVPKTIVNLRMLQYLLLRNCRQIDKLPENIRWLRNLRCLDIAGSGITDINWKFCGMEELTSIRGFPMGNSLSKKKEVNNGLLQSLNLKNPGKLAILRIEKLENVLEPPHDKELPIKKYQLKELELCYNNADPPLVADDRLNKIREVLDCFHPDERLVHLKIENYHGKQYPSWILMLPNLQRLHLQKCVWCDELPSLGELKQLKFLAVTGFNRLSALGAELRGNVQVAKVAFPRLQQLHIGDMPLLHRWSDLHVQDMPQLQILRLSVCASLVAIPLILQKSTTLTRLEVDTETEIAIADKLQAFAKGIVFNVDKKWQEDKVNEVAMTSQKDGCAINEKPRGS